MQPGHNVLEVGSGSGWLAGILSCLVGPSGRVTGIEIIPELATQSMVDLRSLGIRNVEIVCSDGRLGYDRQAPYDRVIFTAAAYDLPASIYEQMVPGGLLILPVRTAAGRGETIYILRRTAAGFESLAAFDGFFVDLVGQPNGLTVLSPASFPGWSALTASPARSRPWWWGSSDRQEFTYITTPFRTFLTITRPSETKATELGSDKQFAFGLASEESICLAAPGQMITYGTDSSLEELLASIQAWSDLGMPSGATFSLKVQRSTGQTQTSAAGWRQDRGDSIFLWKAVPRP